MTHSDRNIPCTLWSLRFEPLRESSRRLPNSSVSQALLSRQETLAQRGLALCPRSLSKIASPTSKGHQLFTSFRENAQRS